MPKGRTPISYYQENDGLCSFVRSEMMVFVHSEMTEFVNLRQLTVNQIDQYN